MDYRKGTAVVKLRKRGNLGNAHKNPRCLNIGNVIRRWHYLERQRNALTTITGAEAGSYVSV
jgi:hypothetical protein